MRLDTRGTNDLLGHVHTSTDQEMRSTAMERAIIGYHQDEEGDWVAHLACGHQRHVRHNPPWMMRPWVTTEEGRRSRLGEHIACGTCDREEADRAPGI